MSLTSLILQAAIAVMTFINANPSIPQWQHDQGIAIAQQALQFANQAVGYTNTGYNNCSTQYPYTCNGTYNYNTCNGYSNCGYSNCTTNTYGYQSCPATNTTGNIQILVLGPENLDTNFVQNGRNYTIVWSPFDASLGYATVQLTNAFNYNLTTIGTMNGNTLNWFPSGLAAGNYTLRVTQQGAIIGSRSVTIQ